MTIFKTRKQICPSTRIDGGCSRPKGHAGFHANKTTGEVVGGWRGSWDSMDKRFRDAFKALEL